MQLQIAGQVWTFPLHLCVGVLRQLNSQMHLFSNVNYNPDSKKKEVES